MRDEKLTKGEVKTEIPKNLYDLFQTWRNYNKDGGRDPTLKHM